MNAMSSAPKVLYPHQQRALDEIKQAIADGKKRIIVQAPTGFGKTLTAAWLIREYIETGGRIIFTVPFLSLIKQTVEALWAEGFRGCVGVIQGKHRLTNPMMPIQVCSVETLRRRDIPRAALVVVDEAHRQFEFVQDEWMADPEWANTPFIGLSATPWSVGLGKHWKDLIIASTTRELIDLKFLSDFVVYAPSQPDLTGIKTIAGDYHEGQLAKRIDQPKLVGDVIETWIKRGENRPTLCYGINRAHAEHLQQRFVERGIAAEYMDGFTERDDRERTFDRFRSGETKIICNVGVLTTGVDLPLTSCIIDARPTKSERLYVQTIGRGLRTSPGKDKCIVLDHGGNALRLGLVTDIHYDKLDDGKHGAAGDAPEPPERGIPLPRACEKCAAVLPAKSITCTECGHVREAKSQVVHADGELVEYGSGEHEAWVATIADQTAFYCELMWIVGDRGHKEGWAAHKFKERFGHFPRGAGAAFRPASRALPRRTGSGRAISPG